MAKRAKGGDVVRVNKKGRTFHALVETATQERKGGKITYHITPIEHNVTYFHADGREIKVVWRKLS